MKRWGSVFLLIASLLAASPASAGDPGRPKTGVFAWARRMLGGLFGGSRSKELASARGEKTLLAAKPVEKRVEKPIEKVVEAPVVTTKPVVAQSPVVQKPFVQAHTGTQKPVEKTWIPPKTEDKYEPPKPIEYKGRLVALPTDGGRRSYRLGEEVGHGKWSVTHVATDIASGEKVAIKLTKPSRLDVGHVDTFREEAERLGKLKHGNIMTTRGVGMLEGTSQRALVMDYVPGETVGVIFGTRAKTPRPEAIAIAMKIIDGAAAMHAAGIVHKSLHVGNVMFERGPTIAKSSVKIIDLGGSKEMATTDYRPSRDWHDIGALLAFMLTGEKGWKGGQWPDLDAAMRVLPDVTVVYNKKVHHLRDVIAKATNKDPAKGFASGEAFKRALQPFLKAERWQIPEPKKLDAKKDEPKKDEPKKDA